MKVNVNKDACIGCGACQAISENVFEIGDDGLSSVKVDIVNDEDIDDVEEAINACPTSAIEEINE